MSTAPEHFDIVLIGSGSNNSFPGPEFADRRIAYIDRGVGPHKIFGGTCLNVGCIPTKMFVHAADLAHAATTSQRFGVDSTINGVHFPAIRDRIFNRIDPISRGGEQYRAEHPDNDNLTYMRATARFVGPKEIEATFEDGTTRRITGDTFVLGAGSRPFIPPIPGLAEAQPLTSDTIMRIPELPSSIAILGSGVIALEFAHIMEALGVRVHIIARSASLLRTWDHDVSERITAIAKKRYDVHTEKLVREVETTAGGVRLHLQGLGDERDSIEVDQILVSVGRIPNSDVLNASAAGIAVCPDGRIAVDEYQRVLDTDGSVIDGVFSIGDLSTPQQLKHVANRELRIVRHNILHPHDLKVSNDLPVPAAVFTYPQIAGVGMTEFEALAWAEAEGRSIRIGRQEYAHIAYGWAMEMEAPGEFAKVIMEEDTGRILGAHVIGPQAPTLIQQLVQAMSFGQDARELARGQYWIHPAMPELIENALLQLGDDAP